MKKLIFIFFTYSIPFFSQTDLNIGDIAFTGYQSHKGDRFAFVLLTDITSRTEIVFTDQGWIEGEGFIQSEPENTITWISTTNMNYGLQILIRTEEDANGDEFLSTSHGSVAGDPFGLNKSGDQLFAYQGDKPTTNHQENFLAAIQMNGGWNDDFTDHLDRRSSRPSAFTDGLNSLFIDPEVKNAVYDCSITTSDASILRAAVNNSANWKRSDDAEEVPIDIPYCQEPLPVELVAFNVNIVDNNVELNWETATEVNNYGFEIERRADDQNKQWTKLGFVNGHGNSNSNKYYTYIDNTIEVSGKCFYRLKQIDIDGAFEYSDEAVISFGAPKDFKLKQNYPNPFNPTTNIKFNLPSDGHVSLIVFNVLGEEVAELVNGNTPAGFHNVVFNASGINSGIYFYKIQTSNFVQIRKMLLVK